MDVLYFLDCRAAFIRQFYAAASAPFLERKRKINAQQEPFIPPYSEDGEPPFLDEYTEADESLNVLAYSCISMLASALHLFLQEWSQQSGDTVDKSLKPVSKAKGWLARYNVYYTEHFGISFENGPANVEVLEEIVLARNCVQHPRSIVDQKTQYLASDMKKLRHPLFVSETEMALLGPFLDNEVPGFMTPSVHVTEPQLLHAISEIERFAKWFDGEIRAAADSTMKCDA